MTSAVAPNRDGQPGPAPTSGHHTIVIAEADPRMTSALVRMLSQERDFRLVGQASDGRQAVELVVELHPDVVLMNVEMPRMTGIEATRRISRDAPETKTIALSAYSTASHVLSMFRAGACGYLLKTSARGELYDAIKSVLLPEGRFVITPCLVRLLAEHATGTAHHPVADGIMSPSQIRLTIRELEVVKLLACGFNNREIGERMFLSESTVKTHLNHVTRKLGVKDRVQVLIRSYELGIVTPAMGYVQHPARPYGRQ